MKKEKRRRQEHLRRIKHNKEKAAKGIVRPSRRKKPRFKPNLKLKCGACGQVSPGRLEVMRQNYIAIAEYLALTCLVQPSVTSRFNIVDELQYY